MKRKIAALGTLVAISSVTMLLSLPDTATGADQTLRFFARYQDGEGYNVDERGDGNRTSAGESFVGEFVLRENGDKAGNFQFICRRTSNTPKRELCIGGIQITGKGQITAAGAQAADVEEISIAITGGTGAYRGVTGVGHLSFGRSGVAIRLELQS